MLYQTFNGNELLIIPNPNKPLFYQIFMVLHDTYANSLADISASIDKYLKKNNIDPDNVETVDILTDIRDMKKNHLAKALSLYSVYNIINDKKAYELPFVPEFAHDKSRFDKIINRKYNEIPPISCEIFPTINCLNRCHRCAYKTQKIAAGTWCAVNTAEERWHMTTDIVENLVRKIKNAGVKYMVITGGGDPLFNYEATIEIFKKAYELKKEGWDIKYGIYTNANCLMPSSSDRNITSLLDYEPEFIRVSMNSATNDTYIDHHNPLVKEIDYIDRIKQNVINLLKTKMKDNKTTRIGLSYLIDPVTVKDIGFFADWINKIYRDENLKPDFIRFAPAIDYFSHSQYPQEFFNEAVEKFDNEAKAKIEETGAQVTLYKHRFNSINEKKTYKRCLGSYFFLETTCDGTVFTCCETAFFPGYNMGNLAQHEYAAIQKSKMFNAVKKRIDKNGLISCPTFCKPHNINKILCDIDAILDKNTAGGNTIELISKWLDGLHKYWDYELPANSKFKKPQIVAF